MQELIPISSAAIGSQGFSTAPTSTVGNGNFHFTGATPSGQASLPTQGSSSDPKYVINNPASNVLGGLTPHRDRGQVLQRSGSGLAMTHFLF
ncbi:hypothetical protein ACIPF8_01390 [Collimonas sp. NPDC087041]|uniref:hypothetical protein n=1 Tax=Collimonas sp. NPDC087041 TaxID=3363960 RepID=UPI00380BEC97